MTTKYWTEQMQHEPTKAYYDRLVGIIKHVEPKRVLEIGTGWGISGSAFMDCLVPELVTLDPNIDSPDGKVAMEELNAHNINTELTWMKATSKEFLPKLAETNQSFDLIYIDGDHGYEGVKSDIEMAVPLLTEKGFLLFDDFFHAKNLDPDSGGYRYGIIRAVREYLLNHPEHYAIIFPTKFNGFILI